MRYHKLDGLRGLLLISMIGYHTCWDMINLIGISISGYTSKPGFLWQQSICWGFILLSGFCAALGHHGRKRGLIVFCCGLAVTCVTLVFMPEARVVFGILIFLGSAMLISEYLRCFLEKIPPLAGIAGFFFLFYLTYPINRGYLQWGSCRVSLPGQFYQNLFSTYLGFMEPGFFSADYYSIFPWIFLFWTGFELCIWIKAKTQMTYLEKSRIPFLEWMGRHALPIYLLHQPVIYLLLTSTFISRAF